MGMKKSSGQVAAVFASMVVVALLAVSCGSSGSGSTPSTGSGAPSGARAQFVSISGVPGVSDKEIDYAVIGTKTANPLGTCILDCYAAGVKAYFKYQNDEFGGIYGRQLKVDQILDDELGSNQVRSLEVVSDAKEFGAFGAALIPSGFGTLNDAGIPTYVWGINAVEETGRSAVFGSIPVYCASCTSRALPYQVGRSHATKVAAIGYGVSESTKQCTKSLSDSVEKYSADIGDAKVVYFNDGLPYGLSNGVGPEVTAMKAAGVDFIATCTDLNAMKTIAQELHRQGMDSVTLSHPNSYDQSFIDAADGLFEGDYVFAQFRPFEATPNEAQTKFKEYIAKVGAEPTELAMTGWINATTAVEGLLAAGPEFNRQKVIDATNSLTADTAGGLVNPIDWTKAHNPPTQAAPASGGWAKECLAAVQVVNGKFQTIADPATPFLCWSNDNRDWSAPQQFSFEAN
jgi:hypothetical protein